MNRLRFSSLSDLRQYEPLATPLWVFDVDRHAIWWANAKALAFWKADSLEDLRARDFDTDSLMVRQRLRQIIDCSVDDPLTQASVQEAWTLYPLDHPINTTLSFQPIRLDHDARDGVLVEVVHINEPVGDPDTLRVLEAARGTALCVSTFTLDGALLAQNPAAAASFGRSRLTDGDAAEAQGTSGLAARFRDPAVAEQLLKRVRDNEEFSWEAEVHTLGGLRTHLVSARRARDPVTGAFVAILSEEDVTELALLRRRQQSVNRMLEGAIAERTDRLRLSEERYALALETAPIWDWDVPTHKVFLSPRIRKTLGYEDEEFNDLLRGEGGLEKIMFPGDAEAFRTAVTDMLRRPRDPISVECRCLTKQGRVVWLHAQGIFVCDDAGNAVRAVGVTTDITELKDLQASLMAAQRLEAVGQLTGGIAHDFNNLLTVIQGNAQLLEEVRTADPELLGEIVKAVGRGAELTRHLLAFSRQQTLNPQSVRLDQLMGQMRNTLLRTLSGSIEVELDLPEALWPVFADPTQVEAALLNIAINARDAMPAGGTLTLSCRNRTFGDTSDAQAGTNTGAGPHEREVTLALGNRFPELAPGDYVELSVTDTGHGMSPDTLAKAVEPFFTTKGVGHGSGLGLSMVLGFSRQSGGDLRIESVPDQGTTVSMMLPRCLQVTDRPLPSPSLPVRKGRGEHIHVLEDNASVQSMLARMLEQLGYVVSVSAQVSEAREALAMSPPPRVCLVDVVLPGGQSGVDFARELRSLRKAPKVVLMSGYPNTQLTGIETADLAYDFLTKPIDKATLSATIRSALAYEAEQS